MFRRLFPPARTITTTADNSGRPDDLSEQPALQQPPRQDIPSTPLVHTTDGKTVVRLYVEILGCDHLGPDFDEKGKKVTKTYSPYVKVKLGDIDDKDSIDIHKTKPVEQRLHTRDPIFDHENHLACFCIDGLEVDALDRGLLFKVKDAAAPSKKQDVLGWAHVQPECLWGEGMDNSASRMYSYEGLDHALEFQLIHPTERVTGLAGQIHFICRPATDQDVELCRSKRWGYFLPYEPVVEHTATGLVMQRDGNMMDTEGTRASTPPLQEAPPEQAPANYKSTGAELL